MGAHVLLACDGAALWICAVREQKRIARTHAPHRATALQPSTAAPPAHDLTRAPHTVFSQAGSSHGARPSQLYAQYYEKHRRAPRQARGGHGRPRRHAPDEQHDVWALERRGRTVWWPLSRAEPCSHEVTRPRRSQRCQLSTHEPFTCTVTLRNGNGIIIPNPQRQCILCANEPPLGRSLTVCDPNGETFRNLGRVDSL